MRGAIYVFRAPSEWEVIELTEPPLLERLQQLVGGYLEAVPQWCLFRPLANTVVGDPTRPFVSCVAYCNEHGKLNGDVTNTRATIEWDFGLRQLRDRYNNPVFPSGLVDPRSGGPSDYLVGTVVVVIGDTEFMEHHVADPEEWGEGPEYWWQYGEFIPMEDA